MATMEQLVSQAVHSWEINILTLVHPIRHNFIPITFSSLTSS